LYRLSVDTIRFLSVGAEQKANSGCTGLPLDQIKQFRAYAYGWHAQSLEERKASKKPHQAFSHKRQSN
jgi:hypothetical protein